MSLFFFFFFFNGSCFHRGITRFRCDIHGLCEDELASDSQMAPKSAVLGNSRQRKAAESVKSSAV